MAETIKISLDNLQVEALADLLNTSKKFGLDEFSEKLSIFAYQNAAEFVNHASFVNLQYDVLLDLIKSNWFYAPEIDILRGVLKWHRRMGGRENNREQTDGIANDLEKLSVNNDKHSVVAASEEISNDANTNPVVSNPANKAAEFLAPFSGIVLKTLLSHIRVKQMSVSKCIEETKTELFARYNHMLEGGKYCTQTAEPRQKYVTVGKREEKDLVTSVGTGIHSNKMRLYDRVLKFEVKCPVTLNSKSMSTWYHVGNDLDFMWNLCIMKVPFDKDVYSLKVYLQCTYNEQSYSDNEESYSDNEESYSDNEQSYLESRSDNEQSDWEIVANCELIWILYRYGFKPYRYILPHKSLKFSKDISSQYLGEFFHSTNSSCALWSCGNASNCSYPFEVVFRSICIKEKSGA